MTAGVELVTIGTELLLGFTIDTNGAFLGRVLSEAGIPLTRRTSVRDDRDEIRAAVGDALQRAGLVITTGGLGPTRDDVTKKVIAELFGVPLEFDRTLWDDLVARFARFGRVPAESNRSQAEVPRGALVLPNRWGTAPGLWLSGPPGEVIMLPGVPAEMKGLMTHEVGPRLLDRSAGHPIRSMVLRTTGIPESTLAERIAAVENGLAPLTLAYLPGVEGVDLRLTAWESVGAEADELFTKAAAAIRAQVGDHCYGIGEADLAHILQDELRVQGLKVAVAESCTGGLVGQRITEIPGSSAVFAGGVIAYSNELKERLLGVDPETLARHGAVSGPVVIEMARGIAAATGADLTVAVSGVAGPDGGTEEKPVGTVWFGFSSRGELDSQRVVFPGSRADIRGRAAQFALHGLLRRGRR